MPVENLRMTKFRGAYYLFFGLEKDFPAGISRAEEGACRSCGHPYLVLQPAGYVEGLLKALREQMADLAVLTGHPNEELSIYVCDQKTVFCANCGGEIELPISELLDADRTSFGRYALWMTSNHRRIRWRP